MSFFFFNIRRPPSYTRTEPVLPYTTLFRAQDRELLELMAQGLGYEQMAERLGTTQEAVDRRVTHVFTAMAEGAGSGDARAVDEMKRLHAAVVEKQRSEEHTSELQHLMRITYAVFCLKKKTTQSTKHNQ